MGKGFQFIDSTKTDRVTRRLVRSHAMKGKNVGKVLHRRSRLELDLHAPRPSTKKASCTSSSTARNLLPQQGQQQPTRSNTSRSPPVSTKGSRSKSPEETPSPSDGSSSTRSSSNGYITTPASSVTDLTSNDFLFLDDDLVNLDWLADVESNDVSLDGYVADTLTAPVNTSFQGLQLEEQQVQPSLILEAHTQEALDTTLGARDSLFALAFPVQATPQSQYVISQCKSC